MIGVLIKRGNLDTDIHTSRTPCDMKLEVRVIPVQAKEHKRLPASRHNIREQHGIDVPSQPTERS